MASKTPTEAPPKKEVAFSKSAEKETEKKEGNHDANRPSISRQMSREAIRALTGGIGDAIVDVKISANEKQEADLSRNGYVQLFQDKGVMHNARRSGNNLASSTFGNGCSLWTWSRSQGTCSGRLKPIIDVQLHSTPTSSEFVLAGYTCDSTPIAGQWLWIKRATTDEEEKDAIVNLYISTGRMKDTSDPIWTSPGVGWIRVDGNFTKTFFGGVDTILWLRPARTRSMEVHMASPLRGAVALTEEVRFAKLMSACRLAIRHHVSVQNVKRLATIVMETAAVSVSAGINSNVIRSERMVDFTTLFHQIVKKGRLMVPQRLNKLLYRVGLRLDAKDLPTAFNLFDRRQNGVITLEEFVEVLSLTQYELDLALEKIRIHLLKGCSNPNDASAVAVGSSKSGRQGQAVAPQGRPNAGVLNSGIVSAKNMIGKNIIRENFTLVQVFEMVNTKDDGIFSLDEMMDLAAKVEVFLTEEEARTCLAKMDLDGDDRVEEADFLAFMRQDSMAQVHKAFRVRECAATLRRWLVRGTTENTTATATASASTEQWRDFATRYERRTRRKFPGYLDAETLLLTMSVLGTNLSALEARELTLLVAPEKNGRVHQADLHSFMGREHRSFGVLIALLERDLLRDVIDTYRAHSAAMAAHGVEDADLAEHYRRKLNELKKAVEKVYLQPPPGTEGDALRASRDTERGEGEEEYYQATNSAAAQDYSLRLKRTNMEVISIVQLKDGMEFYFKEQSKPGVTDPQLPNLEEWASLSVLVNADVCDGDIYGVRLKDFLEGVCEYAVAAALTTRLRSGERLSVEQVSRDLQRQIYTEALNCGKGKKPDFRAVFDLFDTNKNGDISLAEFKVQLKRLQLVNKLAEHQLPTLLGMFTKSKQQVRFEDFVAFAMKGHKNGGKGGGLEGSDEEKDDEKDADEEDEQDIEDMTSNVPPVVITRNADCDWLLWHLYRESRKVDSLDPEGVITELQNRCAETEQLQSKDPAISVKELWTHLFELSLQGGMTQMQFLKSVQLLCRDSSGRDDDRVDYDVLCKYVVRMGREFNALVQQRVAEDEGKFGPLLVELKKYFKDLSQEKVAGTDEKAGVARYEKIFRRMDTDGDGMLTAKEFKTGLKRLHYKSVKAWSLRMVRRLFDECDKNRDGLLSIKEFSNYVQDADTPERLAAAERVKQLKAVSLTDTKKGKDNKLTLSDDEDDEVFRKHKVLTDHQLLRKVNDTLMDVVPVDPHGPGRHAEVVRGSVRRFFQRSDPEHRGTVSEERFRAFLRRSGLQDNLTTSELRRLTERLRRRGTGKGEHGEYVIDYEKLCQQLLVSTESVPKSKAEVVLSRFQDAANASAAAGRSFVSLCSLVDLHLTGRVTRQELLHTAKMMDCPLTPYDLEAMLELLPHNAIDSDDKIDYRVLHSVLQTFTPRQTRDYDIEPQLASGFGARTGALPGYASPGRLGATTHMSYNFPNGLHASYNEIATPLGNKVQTPYNIFDDPLSATLRPGAGSLDVRGSAPASSSAYERILRLIVERVKAAVDERSRLWGPSYSLREHLEFFDTEKTGTVATRSFQQVMHELGVQLSPSDLQTLYGLYGRPEDNHIFYDAFLRAVDGNTSSSYPPPLPAHMQASASSRRSTSLPAPPPPTLGNNRAPGGAAYLHPRVLQRYRELQQEGNDPRDFFAVHDIDRSGMVPQGKFAAVISKLQLLQTDHQLARAVDDFSSLSNRALVLYEDFLDSLDRAASAEHRVSLSASMRRSVSGGYVNGSGYDGLRGSVASNDGWEDEVRRFRRENSSRHNDYPVELEDGSESAYGSIAPLMRPLSPPKVSDSLTFSRVGSLRGNQSPSRYHRSDDISPRSSYQRSVAHPSSSPSKVGSKMWGSHTPLAKKGTVVNAGEGYWCCAVCLYVENPVGAQTCAVCDSPNYTIRKDYQVKEQCRNCTFLNGQFAEECEMCGEPLSNATGQPSKRKTGAGRY